jgi:hypothetical protein
MEIFKAQRNTEELLLKEPESGMGYQVIVYRDKILIVYNATIAVSLEDLRTHSFNEEEYAFLSGDPYENRLVNLISLDAIEEIKIVFSLFDKSIRNETSWLFAAESVVEPPESLISSRIPHSYYRYSSFYRDKRVDLKDGSYLPGTYATTYSDMQIIPSGFAAAGRYALPNPASARYVFPILTFDRPTLMGTVRPNFGQAGGGVEVLFKYGANNRPGNSFPINIA